MKNFDVRELDNVPKMVLVALVAVTGYFLAFLVLDSISAPSQAPMRGMMNGMMGFSTTASTTTTLGSLAFALGLGFLASLYLFRVGSGDKNYAILRKALPDDERKIRDEIKGAGEITQDSLRF